MLFSLFVWSVLSAEPPEAAWKQAAQEDGVTVYTREKAGSGVAEIKAVGLIDGTPEVAWKVLRDYENYKTTMPYTEVSQVVATEGGGKVIHFYSVINAPFVSRRDYVLRMVDESDWKDGKGYLKVSWTPSDKGPAPRPEFVRTPINEGHWKLEPREGGARTFATYYLFTDPGGSIPTWIVNRANSTAVPNIFVKLRQAVARVR